MQISKALPDGTFVTVSIGEHAADSLGRISASLTGSNETAAPLEVKGEAAVNELMLMLQQGLRSTLR